MAEARSVTEMTTHLGNVRRDHLTVVDTHLLRWNGVSVTPTNDGIVVFVPKPSFLYHTLIRQVYRFRTRLVTAVWPAPPIPAFCAVVGFMAKVLSDSDSWFRTGPVANILWNFDTKFVSKLPFHKFLPRNGRIAYLAFGVSLSVLLGMMAGQRVVLRVLLKYRGFMYERKPSFVTKIWGAWLKGIYAPHRFLASRHPLLYSFQSALPSLPVPPLQQTIDKYLTSVTPLMDETELAATKKDAKAFVNGLGSRIQIALHVKRYTWASNYVSDWWVKYVYLSGRSSLLINSNYYGMGQAFDQPCTDQLSRAAVTLFLWLKAQKEVVNEMLEPQMLMGTVPLCMAQYKLAFGTTRVPGRECDSLEQFNAGASHVIVSAHGQLFSLETKHPRTYARLTVHEIYRELCHIEASAKAKAEGKSPTSPEFMIPLLTAARRTQWAEIRDEHMMFGVNRASLAQVETAAFVLALDSNTPKDWSEQGKLQLHGNGCDRWVDKSLTVVIFKNGVHGVHAEHTWGDAPTIAHLWETVLVAEDNGNFYNESRTGLLPPDVPARAASTSDDDSALVKKARTFSTPLRWDVSASLAQKMKGIHEEVTTMTERLKLKVFCFGEDLTKGEFGKSAIKKAKMSPDGFIQMALQLAYRREAGHNCLTYEAGMTRLYRDGRTETVRSLTPEADVFVNTVMGAADNANVSVSDLSPEALEECRTALRTAISKHSFNSKEAMTGNGCDRHLFALYVMGKGLGYADEDLKFLSAALSRPWTMSTSQLPQRQTVGEWTKPVCRENVSPSGGFGPVADGGYGVSYMVGGEDYLFFHVSSKTHAEDGTPTTTNSERFSERIVLALKDLMKIATQS